MRLVFDIAAWFTFALLALGLLALVLTSLQERRPRPAWRAGILALLLAVLLTPLLGLEYSGRLMVEVLFVGVVAVALAILLSPFGVRPRLQSPGPSEQLDERDAVFHRFLRLQPGTSDFETYYRTHPEKRKFDEHVRTLPRLGQPGSRSYDPLTSKYMRATFDVLDELTDDLDDAAAAPRPTDVPINDACLPELTRRIKGFARHLGAADVGVTRLNPAYIYSHIGRSPGTWGAPIDLGHSHAIAIAVEMQHDLVQQAPDVPALTETALQYFEAARIARILARYITLLGYEARAHVDGNYRVLCIPIAVDAGLGELSRMGLLIHPKLGPRLRLSVVTTTLPLLGDAPVDFGVQDFCAVCKKCADNCPSGSIDRGDKAVYQGVEKWRTNQDTCYRYWRLQGTDCAVCMNVCPYAHPGTPLHNLVRFGISRNPLARRLALRADDFFYGRKPTCTCSPPEWHARSTPLTASVATGDHTPECND